MLYLINTKIFATAILCLSLCSGALANNCSPELAGAIDLTPNINGWGINDKNHRFIAETDAGISRDSLARLQVKWVFALPDTNAPHTQPFITPDTVFIGDEPGIVYALDRETGCEKWRFDAESTVRTALRFMSYEDHSAEIGGEKTSGRQRKLLTFGTASGEVFGIDPLTGQQQWRRNADEHPNTMVTGSAVDHSGVIFQPVSSLEAMAALNPFYTCCNFRSSVIALDPVKGELLWRSYMIKEEPRLVKENLIWPDHYGPSGAPVWSQPTLDIKRNRLYVGTGENYSSPATETSDAIVAVDLATGEMLWHSKAAMGSSFDQSLYGMLRPTGSTYLQWPLFPAVEAA